MKKIYFIAAICMCFIATTIWSVSGDNKQQNPDTSQKKHSSADIPPWIEAKKKYGKQNYLAARQKHINLLRGIPYNLPHDPRKLAVEQLNKQEKEMLEKLGKDGISPLADRINWTAIGPSPIPNSQVQGQDPFMPGTDIAGSGRISAIAVHPTNPDLIYVSPAQGGVYRSMDGGQTWTPIFDTAVSLAVGAIAIDPSRPSTIYIGTGESAQAADNFFGVGVYRIDSADTKPTLSGPFFSSADGVDVLSKRSISKILVHPTDSNVIFVSTTQGRSGNSDGGGIGLTSGLGIYRSTNATNASATFERIFSAPTVFGVTDMVLEPNNPNNLIAGVAGRGVIRFTNALTATLATTPNIVLSLNTARIELAINRVVNNNIPTVTVLAATSEASGVCSDLSGTLRRSTDAGATWSAPIDESRGYCGGQCSYDIAIAMAPDDASRILLGGNARNTCSSGGLTATSASLRRSTNGTNFTNVDDDLHADTHVAVFAPSNSQIAYTGNDGGIWRSNDGGNTWISRNTAGLNATQFQSIALHPTDRNFALGGTQDNGTQFMNAQGVWRRTDFGDGGYALIDQNAPDTTNVTMYHTYFNLRNSLIGFGRVTSVNNATPGQWGFISCDDSNSNAISCDDDVLFYAPMALGPGNPNVVYFGTDRLYRSIDRGDNFTTVSQDPIQAGFPISSIGISPQNDNVRIVGLTSGSVFRTTTGSSTLTDVTPLEFPIAFVSRAVIDPKDIKTAYVTFSGFGLPSGQHVWKTTNLDNDTPTWTIAGNGIPDVPVNGFVVDPNNSNILYAGTDIGVYTSTNGGTSWSPFGVFLPRIAVFDLAIQNSNRVLRAATHGRGIYEILIPNIQGVTLADLSITASATPNSALASKDLTYTLIVTNSGPNAASNILVKDVLPINTTFVSCSSTGGGVCGVTPGGGPNERQVTFSSLASGASANITFVVTVPCNLDLDNDTQLLNTATVIATNETVDNNLANNTSITTTVASDNKPVITLVPITIKQGSLGNITKNIPVATISDDNTPIANLTLSAPMNVSSGLTVANLVKDANGNVTADIMASCPPPIIQTGSFEFMVTGDVCSREADKVTVMVNIIANTAPVLGTYTSPVNILALQSTTVTPSAAPTDNGTFTLAVAVSNNQAGQAFGGTATVNQTTGVVSIMNAQPGGTFTVTVTATDNCGAMSTRTFNLVVLSSELTTIYVADTLNNRIQKSTNGINWTLVGNGPGTQPGQFNRPEAIAASFDGQTIYVADTANNRIQKTVNGGANWSVIAGPGTGAGPAQVNAPQGLALAYDLSGDLYVADTANNRVLRYPGGNPATAVTIASAGTTFNPIRVNQPMGLAVFISGTASNPIHTLYIADSANNRILKVTNANTSPAATVMAGPGTSLSPGTVNAPQGVCVDASGNVYVADTKNNRVILFTGGNVGAASLMAGPGRNLSPGQVSAAEGVTTVNLASGPQGAGRYIVVGDTLNNRIMGTKNPTAPTNPWSLMGGPGTVQGTFNAPSKIR